jgi:hypothetical protein
VAREIGENAYQILLPVDRDDDDFVLPKHSWKRSEIVLCAEQRDREREGDRHTIRQNHEGSLLPSEHCLSWRPSRKVDSPEIVR